MINLAKMKGRPGSSNSYQCHSHQSSINFHLKVRIKCNELVPRSSFFRRFVNYFSLIWFAYDWMNKFFIQIDEYLYQFVLFPLRRNHLFTFECAHLFVSTKVAFSLHSRIKNRHILFCPDSWPHLLWLSGHRWCVDLRENFWTTAKFSFFANDRRERSEGGNAPVRRRRLQISPLSHTQEDVQQTTHQPSRSNQRY